MDFGEFFKQCRIKTGQTLRQFSEDHGFDPGNISKLERGLLPPPQSEEKLAAYAKALKIRKGDDAYIEFFDLASAGTRNFAIHHISDQELLNKLPVLFRSIDKKDLTEEKLNRIIEIIKKEANG